MVYDPRASQITDSNASVIKPASITKGWGSRAQIAWLRGQVGKAGRKHTQYKLDREAAATFRPFPSIQQKEYLLMTILSHLRVLASLPSKSIRGGRERRQPVEEPSVLLCCRGGLLVANASVGDSKFFSTSRTNERIRLLRHERQSNKIR